MTPPASLTVRLEFEDAEEEDDAPSSVTAKLERERHLFWRRFEDEFGDIGADPAGYWDARLGYFGVPPGEVAVGDLTPQQMLDTVDMFTAIHMAGQA